MSADRSSRWVFLLIATLLVCARPVLADVYRPLSADAPVAGENFGYAIAAVGDRLVVGAPGHAEGRGRIHVFDCSASPCVPEALLTGADEAGSLLGAAVALDADVLAAAAPGEGAGAVRVFRRILGQWIEEAVLDAPQPATNGVFGSALALDPGQLFVGSPAVNGNAGAVWRFRREAGAWSPTPESLQPQNPQTRSRFGYSLALDGDVLAVGAPLRAGVTAIDSYAQGAVHLFLRSGDDFAESDLLLSPAGGAADRFGHSLAMDGTQLTVGAPGVAAASGAAFVFLADVGGWSLQATLTAAGASPAHNFGWRVAGTGGHIVSAGPASNPEPGSACGAAAVFDLANGWQERPGLRLTGTQSAALAGMGLGAASGRWFVGEPGFAAAGPESGRVRVYDPIGAIHADGFELAEEACLPDVEEPLQKMQASRGSAR